MHGKTVDTCLSAFYFIPEWYKTQNMCDEAFSEGPPKLKYYLGLYKIPKVCGNAADYTMILALLFISGFFSWYYRYK